MRPAVPLLIPGNKPMRFLSLSAMLWLCLAPVAQAQVQFSGDAGEAALRALIERDAPTPFLNGGILAVDHGKMVYRIDTGLADFRTGRKIDRAAIFQTASMAKPFTAVAILQLRDARRLRLDDPVAVYLPGFPYPDITIRHLLSHTSGLPDLELFEELVAKDPSHIVNGADLVPALRSWTKPLPFRPGERFQYSNINYQLLARIVEAVTKQPFGAYVRDHIFGPAGMRSSFVLGTRPLSKERRTPITNHDHVLMYRLAPEDVTRLATTDVHKMRPYRYEVGNLGQTVGDQNLFTTMDDLAHFDRALLDHRILSASSQAEAYAPVKLNDGSIYFDAEEYKLYGARCSYGLGWETCVHPKYGRLVGHAGYNRGIQTILYRNPARRQLLVMYDNADTSGFADKFAAITKALNGDAVPTLDRRQSLVRAYGETLVQQGPTAALLFYLDNRDRKDVWIVTRGGMNALGYDLLRTGYPALALEPFRLNALSFPQEPSVWNSFGDAWAANAQDAEAMQAYRRSLKLKPEQLQTIDKLRALEHAISRTAK